MSDVGGPLARAGSGKSLAPIDFVRQGQDAARARTNGAEAGRSATERGSSSAVADGGLGGGLVDPGGVVPEGLPPGMDVPPDDGGDVGGGEPLQPGLLGPDQAPEPAQGAARAGRGRAARTASAPAAAAPRRDTWIVDALVGQINGRPIFADEFLDPISDRLSQMVREYDRADSRRAIMEIVSQRFDQWVDSELIIAEAESLLSPEERQGLFAWLRNLQETEILQRGGTRTAAEASTEEQFNLTLDQVLEMTKNRALAGDLLRKRVQPRAIVTWRDMERDFDRRLAEFAPGPTIVLGRIQFNTQRQAAEIARTRELFASGKSFVEVTETLGIPDEGRWPDGTLSLGPEGLEGTDFRDEYKEEIAKLQVGGVSPPFEVGSSTVWLSLLERDEPPPKSIFDRDLQLALRAQLEAEREGIERDRYVASLRRQWVAEGIENMRAKLIEIALRRYWR